MGFVSSPSGAGSARPQPFARAIGSTTNNNTSLQPRVAALRGGLRRQLSVLWLRARLLLDRDIRFERAGKAVVAGFDRIGQAIEALSWRAAGPAIRAIEWRRVALVASEPFVLPTELRAALVRILAYLCGIGALSLLAAGLFKERPVPETIDQPIRPAWIDIDKPWPAFQLAAPGFSEEDAHYAIRRHAEGGGRKDTLSFGELGRTQHFMSFEIYRAGDELKEFGNAAEDVRALAAEYGRVSTMNSALPIPSKFGKFQTFEFAIGPFNSYNCVGFARNFDAPRVQIAGLSCNMNLLVDRALTSCALDRLTLMSAGSDSDIARLFAKAELKRSFCGLRDHLLYATPKRPGDVTHAAAPKPRLRGTITR